MSSTSRYDDAYREASSPRTLIGDDLTDEMLDDLWSHLTGDQASTLTADWWKDKPHQLAYRLLLRLTRAEAEVKKAS